MQIQKTRNLAPLKITRQISPPTQMHKYLMHLEIIENLMWFKVDTFVHQDYKKSACIISRNFDREYGIYDGTKIVGYVVSGQYYDATRFY